ncbi:hypothetical protein FB561_3896 [Kribbella amoyensis]|uniref:Uncharacterized protein n=1 Tax=Kribbella amoyensis TaxID=996641 RepID=A0A561BV30_9ACTN|nr:hypothetical protein [Kribbella amoyensis]TWD82755.1 hypothetical protein FB561_3896 [Kribbella amoyensis]
MELDPPRLVDRWPKLGRQLREALVRDDEAGLASQVDGLLILEMCSCDDDFCQSFYTQPAPNGAYPADRHRNWYPEDDQPGWNGHLILDVVDERIAFVEVLHRPPLD